MKTIPLKIIAISCLAGSLTGLAQNAALLTTFTNPTPAISDWFGHSVAAVGSDRVLVGAYQDDTALANAGAAYLFSANGTLLTTFTKPNPWFQDAFGKAVAAVGSDRVLIGAHRDDTAWPEAGAAYLFSTNGAWLATFTNTPTSSDAFGWSVAGVGNDLVLIGAPYYYAPGTIMSGAAYLFSTNGTLLKTLIKPGAADYDGFGWSVAAVGTDRVVIGTPFDGTNDTGAAYLFGTDGAWATTFPNPTPEAGDNFGFAVAGVGSDRVVIGAPYDDTGAPDAGAAYLFSANGTLLTTFTNPVPQDGANFGWSVAAVGSDRVLIGAYADSTGASGAGAAYLFSTNGTLLTTITNPTPADGDLFGVSVAAMGSDRVVIGAYEDNTGADGAGAAYLFNIAPAGVPSLTIQLTITNTVAVSWPSPSTGWNLQQKTNSISSVNWSNVVTTPADDGTTKTVIVNPPTGNRFYRLYKP